MKSLKIKALLSVTALAVLTACSPLKGKEDTVVAPELIKKPEEKVEQKVVESAVATTAAVSGKPDITPLAKEVNTAALSKHPFEDPTSLLFTRVLYFDYDSSSLNEESRKVLAAHGEYLARNQSAKVSIEGHTDERGTREYNMALGDRRAQAVKQVMLLQGAKSSQLETVSYGEEQPADLGHEESAWSKNRRAELNYLSR